RRLPPPASERRATFAPVPPPGGQGGTRGGARPPGGGGVGGAGEKKGGGAGPPPRCGGPPPAARATPPLSPLFFSFSSPFFFLLILLFVLLFVLLLVFLLLVFGLLVVLRLFLGPLEDHQGEAGVGLGGELLGAVLAGLGPAVLDAVLGDLVDALNRLALVRPVGVGRVDLLGLLVGVDLVGALGHLVAEVERPLGALLHHLHLLQRVGRLLLAVALERGDAERARQLLQLLRGGGVRFVVILVLLLVFLLLLVLLLLVLLVFLLLGLLLGLVRERRGHPGGEHAEHQEQHRQPLHGNPPAGVDEMPPIAYAAAPAP